MREQADQADPVADDVMRLIEQQPLQAVDRDALEIPAADRRRC